MAGYADRVLCGVLGTWVGGQAEGVETPTCCQYPLLSEAKVRGIVPKYSAPFISPVARHKLFTVAHAYAL